MIKNHIIILILMALISVSCTWGGGRSLSSLPNAADNVQELADWETRANAAALRANGVIDIEHYEIPLRLLKSDIADDLPQDVKKSMIFNKNGEPHVRWIINPEDTKWHLEVQNFLKENGVDETSKKYFKGNLTASRSMLIRDPNNGKSFSLKVSTNKTGGSWTDKKQDWDDAKQIRKISDWVKDIVRKMKTDRLIIMDEPFAVGIESLDQGMIMRSLNDVPNNHHHYLPGFSALHDEEGAAIARHNGATDVAAFWDKHYNRPLAEALAEFAAYTGVYYDSPHSQNFMIELDQDMKPTGKIVLRDFGDSFLLEDFIRNTIHSDMVDMWEQENVVRGRLRVAIGLLHGNSPPSWLSEEQYKKYADNFFKTFEAKFSEISGIPVSELKKVSIEGRGGFSYYRKVYPADVPSWEDYISFANCLSGELKSISGRECLEIYARLRVPQNCQFHMNPFAH